MKIIIPGGAGSIGTALTRSLAADRHEIVILTRDPARASGLPAGVRAVQWDARTPEGWLGELDGADAVINFAGSNLAGTKFFPARWTDERKKMHYQSRVDAGNAINAAVRAAQRKPRLVVQASAVGAYGPRGAEIVDEATPIERRDFLTGITIDWEDATREVEQYGVRRVIIRTGIYLTPDDGALLRLLLPYKLFAGGPFGNGKQYYSWIHPADEIGAIRFLLENEDTRGIYNLTAPNPVTNNEFGRTLGRVLRRPHLIPIPRFALQLAFGEVVTVVFDGQRVMPRRLLEAGYAFQFPELEGAFRDVLGRRAG
jgi:hypothetical protein